MFPLDVPTSSKNYFATGGAVYRMPCLSSPRNEFLLDISKQICAEVLGSRLGVLVACCQHWHYQSMLYSGQELTGLSGSSSVGRGDIYHYSLSGWILNTNVLCVPGSMNLKKMRRRGKLVSVGINPGEDRAAVSPSPYFPHFKPFCKSLKTPDCLR